MPVESTKHKKTNLAQSATVAAEGDHRKRRRNRTTQSCLNCHTSKRMCDRKRPCGRCTQLGLTGLCVYEVDDPSQRVDSADDKSRLQKRVAELEGVIRELKHKPHPKWTHSPGDHLPSAHSPASQAPEFVQTMNGADARLTPPASDDGSLSISASPNLSSVSRARRGSLAPLPLTSLPVVSFPAHHTPFTLSPSSSHSSLHTPGVDESFPFFTSHPTPTFSHNENTGFLLSYFSELDAFEGDSFANLFDHSMREIAGAQKSIDSPVHHQHGHDNTHAHCNCLVEAANYGIVLELSLRLRRAAETLGQYHIHPYGSSCLLQQRISELDAFTSSALGDVHSVNYRGIAHKASLHPQASSPNMSINPADSWGHTPSNPQSAPFDDSFMSWQPQHQHHSMPMHPSPPHD